MDQIVAYYNELAKKYDDNRFGNSYGQFIDRQERKILNRLLKNSEACVVDVACGSGRLLNYATCGVDASSEMVQVAKAKFPEKEIYVSGAEQLPFANESVDTIISFHFFMHLEPEKIQEILHECHRVLKPGGRLIFDIPSKKRRALFGYKTAGWHAATSLTFSSLVKLNGNLFTQNRRFGLMFFPIHRFPKGIRKFMAVADRIAASLLKEYSSYLVVENIKQ